MAWYEINPKGLQNLIPHKRDKDKLAEAMDMKYGAYDYDQDARIFCEEEFEETLKTLLNESSGKKILITGANQGREIKYFGNAQITAYDLSKRALRTAKKSYPYIETVQGNVETLPFKDNYFDIYMSLRTMQSSNVNLHKAIMESLRVTRGSLLYSISNGYVVNGSLEKGMYDYELEDFDKEKPYDYANRIRQYLQEAGLQSTQREIASEIFVFAKK